MPTLYPNLDHPNQFLFSISSSNHASTSSLPLSPSITTLASRQIDEPHDFNLERRVIREEEERRKEETNNKARKNNANNNANNSNSSRSSRLPPSPPNNTSNTTSESKSAVEEEEARMNEVLRTTDEEKDNNNNNMGGNTQGEGTDTVGTNVRRAMLSRMKSLTLAPEDECTRYLEGSKYNLEEAVQNFYGDH